MHEQSGAFDAAIEAFRRAGSLASLGRAYALSGRTDEATDVLRQLHDAAKTSFVSACDFALIHVALGDRDEGFAWLEKAWEERSSLLPFLRANPRFATLRDDVRFRRLIERLAFPGPHPR